MHTRLTPACVSAITLALLLGCDTAPPPMGMQGESGAVEDVVRRTTDVWNEKENFDALFTESAKLSDRERKRFQGISVRPVTVAIDGETATVEIAVTTYVNNEPKEANVTWTVAKQGEDWKLTQTPLQ